MIHKIIECNYKGFHLVLDEERHGWKCVIGEQEILFPTSQDAKLAINEILKDSAAVIKERKGVVLRTVPHSQATKTVEMDKLY